MQAQKINPCLRVGDKLIEIDGHSLRNIDHNVSKNVKTINIYSNFRKQLTYLSHLVQWSV